MMRTAHANHTAQRPTDINVNQNLSLVGNELFDIAAANQVETRATTVKTIKKRVARASTHPRGMEGGSGGRQSDIHTLRGCEVAQREWRLFRSVFAHFEKLDYTSKGYRTTNANRLRVTVRWMVERGFASVAGTNQTKSASLSMSVDRG
jgi:hypothetical protein